MVTVQEASQMIFQNLFKPDTVDVSIEQSAGNVLAEEVISDRDFPPFDRVSMDGIAIQFEAWKQGRRQFKIEALQAAGQPVVTLLDPANAIEVMTGASLPNGTDAVIPYEEIKVDNGVAMITASEVKSRSNIHRRAQDSTAGDVLLSRGMLISPAEVALLASVGKAKVRVRRYPRATLVSSGDELVDISASPGPHQIRRSNTYALQAAMQRLRWEASLIHLPDEREALLKGLGTVLRESDVVILSGGVSKGKFDFIPSVLSELGVNKIFHQVSQRPGKPFWFGAKENKTVFALPGNPVSTFMCFHRYIVPWLLKSLGLAYEFPEAALAHDFSFEPNLTYFLQVSVRNERGRLVAYPRQGGGSGDFVNLKDIDGFVELPRQQQHFKAGEVYPYIPFR